MFKFIFFMFFFLVLLVLLMGFSVLRTIKNVLFGTGKKKTKQRKQTTKGSASTEQRTSQHNTYNPPSPRKKIIAEDEGEYVDYEEVKQ